MLGDMMRIGAVWLALLTAACSANLSDAERAQSCVDLFKAYDSAVRTERLRQRRQFPPGQAFGFPDPSATLQSRESALRQYRCVTGADALVADLSDPRGQYGEYRHGDAGLEGDAKILAVGTVANRDMEVALTRFFAALGYPVRTVYADRLGWRLFLGPMDSAGAERAATELARKIGFQASYFVTRIPVAR